MVSTVLLADDNQIWLFILITTALQFVVSASFSLLKIHVPEAQFCSKPGSRQYHKNIMWKTAQAPSGVSGLQVKLWLHTAFP